MRDKPQTVIGTTCRPSCSYTANAAGGAPIVTHFFDCPNGKPQTEVDVENLIRYGSVAVAALNHDGLGDAIRGHWKQLAAACRALQTRAEEAERRIDIVEKNAIESADIAATHYEECIAALEKALAVARVAQQAADNAQSDAEVKLEQERIRSELLEKDLADARGIIATAMEVERLKGNI